MTATKINIFPITISHNFLCLMVCKVFGSLHPKISRVIFMTRFLLYLSVRILNRGPREFAYIREHYPMLLFNQRATFNATLGASSLTFDDFHYINVIMTTMASQITSCLPNRLFRCRSKKTSTLRATGLCVGNSPGTAEFPAQMASNEENVSIWWRHHASSSQYISQQFV